MLKKGYTLVELLAVISTVGILASMATPAFQTLTKEAKNIKAQSEVKTLQVIVEDYYQSLGEYPENLDLQNVPQEINIAKTNIYDPWAEEKTPYNFYVGKANSGKNFYIIYSKGLNGEVDFLINNNMLKNQGDDILVTNLLSF